MDPYIEFLKSTGVPVLEVGGATWRPYRKALVLAALNPEAVEVSAVEGREALKKSGCLFLRYFTRHFDCPTEFWQIVCSQYDFDKLSANTRSKVRRARNRCDVQPISSEWLAENGYGCYLASHKRYRGAAVKSESEFQTQEKKCVGGPFQCWGVFVSGRLAGFARCVVGPRYLATLVLKFDPEHLKSYTAYALMDAVLTKYVSGTGKLATNGFRSLAHDTNMQGFLEQFGYRKAYCDLKIIYAPVVGLGVKLLYPFRGVLARAESIPMAGRLKALLAQEEIRRSFADQNTGSREGATKLLPEQDS